LSELSSVITADFRRIIVTVEILFVYFKTTLNLFPFSNNVTVVVVNKTKWNEKLKKLEKSIWFYSVLYYPVLYYPVLYYSVLYYPVLYYPVYFLHAKTSKQVFRWSFRDAQVENPLKPKLKVLGWFSKNRQNDNWKYFCLLLWKNLNCLGALLILSFYDFFKIV
jgi:hypothetical protein